MTVDTEKYLEFVQEVTSAPSTDLAALLSRITELELDQITNYSQTRNAYVPMLVSPMI